MLGREKIETQKVVKEKFTQYYNENSGKIQAPSLIGKREFAFVLLKEKVMLRHRGMATVEDLRSILKETAPSDVYYSCAYYENPDKSMETKGWLGADLVFDIDADHIPSKHIKEHDSTNWLCEVCLELAKEETLKLVDVLASDFGLSLSDLRVAFSGNRGYHVHVENESLISLDQTARKEIVDYMRGIGIEPIFHGFEKEKGPSLDDAGWAGRIARGIYEYFSVVRKEQLEEIGLGKKVANTLVEQKEKVLQSWGQRGPWLLLKGVDSEGWKRIIEQSKERRSVHIDTAVTTDIHRLIRLTDSLHGKTGFKKTIVPLTGIESFDPLKEALAFKKGTLTLLVTDVPNFRIGNSSYGPFKNERVELPTAVALYLLCREAAKVPY